jgi:cell division septation protein DedD
VAPKVISPLIDVAAHQPHSMVEVMALSHETDAEIMVAALNRHGYNVAVRHDPQDSLLHLDVGPFANQKDAESMRQRLLADGYNATIK